MTDKGTSRTTGFQPSEKSISASKRDAVWLLRIANKKDAQALTELFDIYRPKLKGWLMARGVENGTAEDIVQDVTLKVWTSAHLFDPQKASFATWVYRLTRNKWIDHQRKHGRMDVRDPERMKDLSDTVVSSAEEDFMLLESTKILREYISQLTEVQQIVIRMAFFEFKTHKQISEEMGVPLGTAKTRIRSAIMALKHDMAQHKETLR